MKTDNTNRNDRQISEAGKVVATSSNTEGPQRIVHDEVLLPGLFDDIVLERIAPKLPWTAFHTLSSVSRPWRQAIQRHLIYGARVRSHSTEALLVLDSRDFLSEKENKISFYYVRDKSWHQLPPLPNSGRSHVVLKYDQCLSLDGKIYVLGGRVYGSRDRGLVYGDRDHSDSNDDGDDGKTTAVYVLDLTWQREWKPCANMPQPRSRFGSAILDGKIYVFGGISDGKYVRESLVYDPKQNAWSSIMPMKYKRARDQVVAVGEELFVHGGMFYEYNGRESWSRASLTEVYHPGRDEWRLLTFECLNTRRNVQGTIFKAQGNLHMMTYRAIYGHDTDSDQIDSSTLKLRHSFSSFTSLTEVHHVEAVVEVDDELLALVFNCTIKTGHLYRSKGFGSGKEDIGWEPLCCEIVDSQVCPHVTYVISQLMCSVHL